MASPPTRNQVLWLLRSFMRAARDFTDYNIREYAKRRAADAFRHNRTLSNPADAAAAFADGKAQLGLVKRQAMVYSLYSPSHKNIMEVEGSR